MCIVQDTAKRLGVSPREIFVGAAEHKGFSNAPEVAAYRYERWFKHGEVTAFVTDYCLTYWRNHDRHDQAQLQASAGSA